MEYNKKQPTVWAEKPGQLAFFISKREGEMCNERIKFEVWM